MHRCYKELSKLIQNWLWVGELATVGGVPRDSTKSLDYNICMCVYVCWYNNSYSPTLFLVQILHGYHQAQGNYNI